MAGYYKHEQGIKTLHMRKGQSPMAFAGLSRKQVLVMTMAVLLGSAVLVYFGGRSLFTRGSPLLALSARASALVVVALAYGLLLAALVAAIQSVPRYWPGAVKALSMALIVCTAAAAVPFASLLPFFLMHVICYTAQGCLISPLPGRIMHAINVGTTYPVFESILVVAGAAGIAIWARPAMQAASGPSA